MSRAKTGQVAEMLRISVSRLYHYIARGQIAEPERDWSGEYAWSEQDIENVRELMPTIRRGRRPRTAEKGAPTQ